ncbi:MAG: hypothetical protein LQ346_002007 [Caloplaca aetnensis]|nr:MAG: hypothetical protein LQ346_002007 [Caloplaca aetnensis]
MAVLFFTGLDKDARDSNGRTPLHDASRTGEAEVVTLLLAASANKSIKDHWSRSPWDVAWTNRKAEIMLLLEAKTADDTSIQSLLANYPNMDNLPIWSLAEFGQIDILNNAMRSRPESLSHKDPDTGNTALHSAVLADEPQILKTLLTGGLPPNAQNMQSRTPLHLATAFNFQSCTHVLLASSPPPDLNLRDRYHETPLLIAQSKGHYDIAFALIEAGAHIDPEIITVQSLFFLAVRYGKAKAAERLIEAGAMVGAKNVNGKTAWRIAKEVEGMEEEVGEVLRVLRANKSRVVVRRGESYSGEVNEEEEDEEGEDDRRFQISAFRRADIFDEDENPQMGGIDEVEGNRGGCTLPETRGYPRLIIILIIR